MAFKVEYRGGIPELRKTGLTVVETFPDSLHVCGAGFSLKKYKIPYESIVDATLTPEGAKKKIFILSIEYNCDDFPSCAVFSGKETPALYGSLQKWRKKYAEMKKA